jgi:hypothetical protein
MLERGTQRLAGGQVPLPRQVIDQGLEQDAGVAKQLLSELSLLPHVFSIRWQ